MKATRMLLLVCVGLMVGSAVGCSGQAEYQINVFNATGQVQNVTIKDNNGYPDVDAMPVAKDGGRASCVIKQDDKATLSYTFVSNSFSKEFTIGPASDKPMVFYITKEKLVGPVSRDAKVDVTWDTTKTIKGPDKFKVTGD